MKKFSLLLVSLVLMAFGATSVYAEDYAAKHTSNVTFTLGNKSYKEKMNIAGTSYDVVKLGTSSVIGDASFKIPAGTTKIHMHVIGWKGKSAQVNLSADNGVTLGTTSITPKSDDGATNNSPYTLKGDATTYYYEITTTGVEQETKITMTTVSGKTRVIIWGVNTEAAAVDPDATMYTVTTTADETKGTITGAGEYAEGTTVTLTANAKPGYEFASWSNGSTENPLKITLTQDTTISATFQALTPITCAQAAALEAGKVALLNPFDVVYVAKGTGNIYIQDATGSGLIYDFDLDDKLKAGDHVEGFVGVSSPYNGLPEMKVSGITFEDLTVTAGTAPEPTVFATVPAKEDVNKYVVFKGVKLTSNISYTTASATNATISVGGKNATLRNAFKLAASLTSGSTYDIYAFVAIYNGNIQMYYASSVDVSPERTITATVNPAETGTVTGAGTYKEGKTATLTATPAEGYAFTCWTEGEDTVSTAANYSFKVAADRALVANFAKKTYNVTVTAENGTVTGAGEYEENAEATLTATANEGYEFTCWTSGEDTVSTANPYTFAVTANVALVANFKEVVVEEPVEAKLYLTPNANWKQGNARFAAYFFGNGETWVGMTKVDGETDLYEVTIPTDKKYPNVIFCRMNPGAAANNWNNKWNQTSDLVIPTDGKNHYTVKAGTWDKGGGTWSIWPVPTVKTYVDITITVTANAPASIKWANAGDKLANATEYVAMTAGENNTYTYTLAQVDEAKGVDYTIKVGDIVSTTQNTSKNVTVDFKNLLPQVAIEGIDGKWDSSNKMTVSDDYLTASITLPLAAKDHAWKLTIDAAWLGGSKFVITRTNNSVVVKEDANGDGKLTADIAGDYVFTWTYATQTLTVTYPAIPVKYNVTVTAENGTVTGAGEYEENAEATLTATANEGYEFVNWTVGDSIVSTENPYKFTVTADLALVANFKEAVTTITETFDLTTEDTRNLMGTYNVDAGDYLLRIYGYEGAGTYQDDPATEEVVEVQLFTPDYEDPLNAVVVVTIDEENNKEVMQVTAASADGTKIYNLTINIALPSYEKYSLIATGIKAENETVEGISVIKLKGEGYQNGEEAVPFEFMVYESMMGYGAEGTIGEINVFSTKAEFFAEEGEFLLMATMQDEEGKYLFNVEVMGTMPKAEVEIVVKETKDVTLYNLNLDVQGNMAMVTADNMTLSFNLTLLDTENYYGTYTNDAFSNIWYGDDQLYAAYGEAQVYAEVDGKAKFVVSFISTPDAEGNVTLYNFTLYAGDQPTGVDNINTTVAPVKVIENGQIFIISNGVKYNAQGAQL